MFYNTLCATRKIFMHSLKPTIPYALRAIFFLQMLKVTISNLVCSNVLLFYCSNVHFAPCNVLQHPLVRLVMSAIHPHRLVRALGPEVLRLNVKTQSCYAVCNACLFYIVIH